MAVVRLRQIDPRFVVDVGLRHLAEHLRLVGLDCVWDSDADEKRLLEISATDRRILLTPNIELTARAGRGLSLRLISDRTWDQLRQVLQHFELAEKTRSGTGFLTRCLQCNSVLLRLNSGTETIRGRLPAHVLAQHALFFLCPRCERIFWRSASFEKMKRKIDELISEKSS